MKHTGTLSFTTDYAEINVAPSRAVEGGLVLGIDKSCGMAPFEGSAVTGLTRKEAKRLAVFLLTQIGEGEL